MKKIGVLTLVLLFLDLGTKALAEAFLTSEGSFFILHYNPNIAMGIQVNDFVKFILPILGFPIILFMSKVFSNPNSKAWYLSLVIAGATGNFIGRFNEEGVVDFINFSFAICNLADIYLWIAVILFYKAGGYKMVLKKKQGV